MKKERLIIFPTDTVYGIGCAIFDKENIEKIYEIKHRPKNKPLACLCANIDQIKNIAVVDANAEKLVETFLPGALTIILKAKDDIAKITGFDTIGVRIPNSQIALDILQKNGPMLTTSVNESEQIPLNNYDEICVAYGDKVDKIYQSNCKSSNISSTVVSILAGEVKILREGEITLNDILCCLNNNG